MRTLLIYLTTILIVLLLSYNAQKRNKRGTFIFAAVIISLLAGLRAETVGIDTVHYIEKFQYIANGQPKLAYGLEETFKGICAVLLKIWNNSSFLFLLFALVTNVLIFKRLWDFKDYISLSWASIVYFGVFYFMTFNILRQFVAIAIVFFATRYVSQRKYLKFLIFVAIATLFHKSALLGILFIALDLFAWGYLTPKQKKIVSALLILGPAAIMLFGTAIIGRYVSYLSNASWNIGLMLFLKMFLFVCTAWLIQPEDGMADGNTAYKITTTKTYYLVGIFITMLGYIFPYMDRIGIYFYLFEAVFVGAVMKSSKINSVVKLLMGILYLFLLYTAITGNAQGQGNYLFVWQA